MSWRDRLREASFRGVSFHIEESDYGFGGRRVVKHEYPGRDVPFAEDTGRKIRDYQFQAYILADLESNDYFEHRDRLIKALNQKGPGLLIHPYFGEVKVIPEPGRCRESRRKGGVAIFTLAFVEAGERKYPGQGVRLVQQIEETIVNAITSIGDLVADAFNIEPFAVLAQTVESMHTVLDNLDTTAKRIQSNLKKPAHLIRSIQNAGSRMQALVKQPAELITELQKLYAGLYGELNQSDAYLEFKRLYNDSVTEFNTPISGYTDADRNAQKNTRTIALYRSTVALVLLAKSLTDTEPVSKSQNRQSLLELVGLLDEHSERVIAFSDAGDTAYRALRDLKVLLIRHIKTESQDTGEITIKRSVPVMVFLYEQDSADKEIEFLELNNIDHPGFIPAGSTVRIG